MLHPLLLSLALTIGQADASSAQPLSSSAESEPAAPAAAGSSAETPAAPEPWLLTKSLQGTCAGCFLDCHKIKIYGWTDASFTASSAAHNQLPMGFNYRANEFLLQQNWLRVEKAVDTSQQFEPSFGFTCDTILPGSDYRFTLPRGLFDGQLTANGGQPNFYGIDPIQFFVEAYFPTVAAGLDVKIGRMFCQYGVEVNDAISNPLCSHNYTYIYDPYTHTGIMATVKLDDTWTAQVGMTTGPDVFIDPASEPYGMASIKFAPPQGCDTLLLSVLVGSGRFNQQEQFNNPNVFDLVYTHKFNDKLTYSFESLFGYQTNVPTIGTADWYGILDYLTYTFTPKVSGTVRLEFFEDAQGQRTGFKGLYTAMTAGLSFKPHRAVIIRPELRYDYNGESRPFENDHGLFTAAADFILRW